LQLIVLTAFIAVKYACIGLIVCGKLNRNH
jgi:hypothetical protein